jgi:hypothetical protein
MGDLIRLVISGEGGLNLDILELRTGYLINPPLQILLLKFALQRSKCLNPSQIDR